MRKTLSLALLPLLAACSGSGSARVLLTDAPADIVGVTSIKVTISSLQAHVEDESTTKNGDPGDRSIDNDGKWVTLVPSPNTFDLISLTNNATAALGSLQLPTGKITQIRLFLDTSKPDNNQVVVNGQTCNLDTTNVKKEGIKIDHVFKAFAVEKGHTTEVTVDFDGAQSITLTQPGTCTYVLDPKIHIKRVHIEGHANDEAVR